MFLVHYSLCLNIFVCLKIYISFVFVVRCLNLFVFCGLKTCLCLFVILLCLKTCLFCVCCLLFKCVCSLWFQNMFVFRVISFCLKICLCVVCCLLFKFVFRGLTYV